MSLAASHVQQEETAVEPAPVEPRVRVVLGTMTMGPAIGDQHNDNAHSPLPSYCQTPPDVALQQLQLLIAAPHARVKEGPEAGKYMIDTASIYQDWCTESTLGTRLLLTAVGLFVNHSSSLSSLVCSQLTPIYIVLLH